MRAMPIPMLQDEGFLFLWVTGRAMEIGRECLEVWGYQRVDEVVWLKTNQVCRSCTSPSFLLIYAQLQRVIRTGRTGHWLNHTKEHLLIGVKRSPSSSSPDPSNSSSSQSAHLRYPSWGNAGLSTDVLVSEVRETSRKPDEIYGIIERLCPGGRKVEIFGRKHNIRPGWLTLGNQLGRDNIWEEGMREAVMRRYPERAITQTIDDQGQLLVSIIWCEVQGNRAYRPFCFKSIKIQTAHPSTSLDFRISWPGIASCANILSD